MHYEKQKEFFETAYRTGTDNWTHKDYKSKVMQFLSKLPKGGMVLDIGAGRGYWAFTLEQFGFKVIALENIPKLVEVGNKEVKAKHLSDKMRFIEGDIFDLNFEDNSFDAVIDIGLVQHLRKEDWDKYRNEIVRVLKPGGMILNVSLSKNTKNFLDFYPKESDRNDFEKYNSRYHFFTWHEINELYGKEVKIIEQEEFSSPESKEVYWFTLYKKEKGA